MRPKCEIAYMCPSDFPCKDCDRGHSKLGKVIVCNEPRKEEKIAALISALKELGVDVPVWMPIETAPKDGTKFLFLERCGRIQVGRYDSELGEPKDIWVCLTARSFYPANDVIAWMPLPTKQKEEL